MRVPCEMGTPKHPKTPYPPTHLRPLGRINKPGNDADASSSWMMTEPPPSVSWSEGTRRIEYSSAHKKNGGIQENLCWRMNG